MARKKTLSLPSRTRKTWVERSCSLSIRRQCRLAGISRNHVYYSPKPQSDKNLRLMRKIDEQVLRHPEFGSPRMHGWLVDEGLGINHKRVERLMKKMGVQAITPGPHTSRPCAGSKIYPYLLRDVEVERVNQVWSTDITYIPMARGFFYLAAVIDWQIRYVLSWELSNSLDADFCVQALEEALVRGTPEVFNTDQGSQFTSNEFVSFLRDKEISISMDGRGRALDNVFIERLWWTVKYEDVYPRVYGSGDELERGLARYFKYYNEERKHSALDRKTPAEVFLPGTV